MGKAYHFLEKHQRIVSFIIVIGSIAVCFGVASVKLWPYDSPHKEKISSLSYIHKYHVGKVIDQNIGRYILLREHKPGKVRMKIPPKYYIKNTENLDIKPYRFAIDEEGYIFPAKIYPDPDLKIVFLGGSTTESMYVDEKQRFPYLVGRTLGRQLGKKVNSYNAGRSANESMHSINILINKVLRLKPDVVVMMHNINDLLILRSQGTYWYQASMKSHVQTASELLSAWEHPLGANNHKADEKLIAQFKTNLKTFIAICKAQNIAPVLMTQANRLDFEPLHPKFNQAIIEVGAAESVMVIDLEKQVPATTEYLYDAVHFNNIGSQKAAQIISKHLAQLITKVATRSKNISS